MTGLEIEDAPVALLSGHAGLKLDRLYLARNALTDGAAESLANGAATTQLRILCLGGNVEISDEGAESLAGGKSLANLTHLELNHTGVGDDGAQAIVKSRVLKALRKLDLRQSEAGDVNGRKGLEIVY